MKAKPALRRITWITGGTLAAVLASVLAFRGLTADLGPEDDVPLASLRPESIARDDLLETVAASGTMEPRVRVPVIAEVSGIIATVHVEEGARVERGQPLFELDRERLEARVAERQAELSLRQANARFDLVGRARVDRDRAALDAARAKALRAKGVASELEFERAERDARVAEIAVRDADAELAARAAAVLQAREALHQAERDLRNAVVRAPIDGRVIERAGELGRAVADVTSNGGTTIAVIADDTRSRLVAEIDENDVARVRLGQRALVTLDALPDESFEGTVRKVSSAGAIEANVSSFTIDVELPGDERLRVGMSADARIVIGEHPGVLLIPNSGLVRREREVLVRVPDVGGGNAYRLVPVKTGYSDGFRTIVSEGLAAGDVILVARDETKG
jgi:HlyD family secretion protein